MLVGEIKDSHNTFLELDVLCAFTVNIERLLACFAASGGIRQLENDTIPDVGKAWGGNLDGFGVRKDGEAVAWEYGGDDIKGGGRLPRADG